MPRKKKLSEDAAPNLIQIMTVSLFIILLAFFILLNAIAVEDDARRRQALGSLQENFGVLSGGFSLMNNKEQTITTEKITEITNLLDFSDLIKDDDDPINDLVVTSEKKRSIVTLPAGVVFEPESAEIKETGHGVLDRLCRLVNETEYSVDIAGHMDKNAGAADTGISARELSSLRALSVLRYFIEEGNVDADLVTAYGWGDFKPLTSNKIREGRALNQRLEITIAHERRLEKPEGFFTFKNFFFNVFDQ